MSCWASGVDGSSRSQCPPLSATRCHGLLTEAGHPAAGAPAGSVWRARPHAGGRHQPAEAVWQFASGAQKWHSGSCCRLRVASGRGTTSSPDLCYVFWPTPLTVGQSGLPLPPCQVVIPDAEHACYMQQPKAFHDAVIPFMRHTFEEFAKDEEHRRKLKQ